MSLNKHWEKLVLLSALTAASCPAFSQPLNAGQPQVTSQAFITTDGQLLPLHVWLPAHRPKAVLLALHGFNDYGRFIEQPAKFFQTQGIAVYAYDQRGFGAAPNRGRWAGVNAYVQDLIDLAALIRDRYPETPLYVLGESMGGAVAIVAASRGLAWYIDGLILVAPAVWARQFMPWYQRGLLALANWLIPWVKLTGKSLDILASDNLEMLRALGRDPLVIKATRIDALAGLADLMDQAVASASSLHLPTLYLYGAKDQIIPSYPTRQFLTRVNPKSIKLAWYESGYHLLLRDLQAKRYWHDILAWLEKPTAPLPSGADRHIQTLASGQLSTSSN